MQFLINKRSFKVSDNLLQKIVRDFRSEIKDNKSAIKKLTEIDYKYNKKIIDIDVLLETVNLFKEAKISNEKSQNIIVCYNGNPVTTIQLLFMAFQNSSTVNLVINDLCYGVNKLLVTLFQEILKDYKLQNIVSLNRFLSKKDFYDIDSNIDKVSFLGSSNLYTLCKDYIIVKKEFIPFDSIVIYCENDNYTELAQKTFEFCYENNIEAEVYDMDTLDIVKDSINNEEIYISLILSDNQEIINRFKTEIKCSHIYVNENPFRNKIEVIPNIFI